MNTDVLDKPIVLSLSRAWQVIGHRTVKQALITLNGGAAGLPPVREDFIVLALWPAFLSRR